MTIFKLLFKLNSILVINSYRRQSMFISFQTLIIKRVVLP